MSAYPKLSLGEKAALARGVGHLVYFWPSCVRFPALGYAVGASAAQSAGSGVTALLLLYVISVAPALGVPAIAAAFAVFFIVDNVWLASVLACLAVLPYIESTADRIHTQQQAFLVLSDLLTEESPYSIVEIKPPTNLEKDFPGYKAKKFSFRPRRQDMRPPLDAESSSPLEGPVMRLFQFIPLEGGIASAAVAYPVHRYASLIFVRQTFDDLNDAQRFQIYHELAHGTPEGTEMMLRKLRWDVAFPITIFSAAMLIALASWWVYKLEVGQLGLAMLLLGVVMTALSRRSVAQVSAGAAEVIADSIALLHPDFVVEEKWKRRAENLAKRLEGELIAMGSDDSRRFQVAYRRSWLLRHLTAGRVNTYHATDVDVRCLIAAAAFVASGYFAVLPDGVASDFFAWACGIAILGLIRLGSNGMASLAAARAVQQGISQKMTCQ